MASKTPSFLDLLKAVGKNQNDLPRSFYIYPINMKEILPECEEIFSNYYGTHDVYLYNYEGFYIVFVDYGYDFFEKNFRVYSEREFDYDKFLNDSQQTTRTRQRNDLEFVMEFFIKIGLKRPEEELVKYIRKRFLDFAAGEKEPLTDFEKFNSDSESDSEFESDFDDIPDDKKKMK